MFWNRKKKLAVAMTCSDWRLHQRVVDFNSRIGRATGTGEVDLVALPGPDGLLKPERAGEWDAAKAQVKLLADAHHAAALAVVAHQRCAGHPVSDGEHDHDVQAVAKSLKESLGFSGPVYALVATYKSDRNWGIKEVGRF
ncbi:MAG: carbonic anhydrase [Rhizomicrobium sp.]